MSSINKKSRPARRVKRGQHSLRRWQFEQLESRAMLAVMGPMPYYGGDHGPQLQSFHDSPQFEAAVFAPPQFQQNVVAGPLDRGWGGGPMQGGFHDDRFMFRQYVVIEVWNVAPPNSSPFQLDAIGTSAARLFGSSTSAYRDESWHLRER